MSRVHSLKQQFCSQFALKHVFIESGFICCPYSTGPPAEPRVFMQHFNSQVRLILVHYMESTHRLQVLVESHSVGSLNSSTH